jgi:hypothetical protein
MPDEAVLREFARFGMRDGRLPRREPHRIWGRPGIGALCAVCETPVTAKQMEYGTSASVCADTAGPNMAERRIFALVAPCIPVGS